MRLSDIKDEERFGVVDEAAAIIERLAKNEDFKAMMFKDDIDPKTDPKIMAQIMNKRVFAHMPKLMRSAKADIVAYLAVVEGISEEEYSKDLSLGKIFNGVLEMIKDPIFINFFYLSQAPSAEQP